MATSQRMSSFSMLLWSFLVVVQMMTSQAADLNLIKTQTGYKAKYRDCQERWKAGESMPGVYTIYPNSTLPIQVYCNHTATGSSTVIQRRMFGNESFNRGWIDYKLGFGNLHGDFWLGLGRIRQIILSGSTRLRIDMMDWYGRWAYADYGTFFLGDEASRYRLTIGSYTGNVIDDMAYINGMPFSTPDRPDVNYCATHTRSGWWFNYCAYSLLNGVYYYGGKYVPPGQFCDGIFWKDWYPCDYSLQFVSMTLYK